MSDEFFSSIDSSDGVLRVNTSTQPYDVSPSIRLGNQALVPEVTRVNANAPLSHYGSLDPRDLSGHVTDTINENTVVSIGGMRARVGDLTQAGLAFKRPDGTYAIQGYSQDFPQESPQEVSSVSLASIETDVVSILNELGLEGPSVLERAYRHNLGGMVDAFEAVKQGKGHGKVIEIIMSALSSNPLD